MPIAKACPVLTVILGAITLASSHASSLEGDELKAYDAHCPAGNYRAVWAEPLLGILEGWVNLVCLNEDLQQTSYWYVTPEGNVVSPDEAELPVYVRPMASDEDVASINALGDDDAIELLLDFKYEQPDVPPLEEFGYPAGSYGSSSSSASGGSGSSGGSTTGGTGGSVESTYLVNGKEVSEAEYKQWETLFLAASRAQDAERDRLILEQVHLSLYDLVELNQWHDWVDVDAINSGAVDYPRWEYKKSLLITLTGKQARALMQSSEGLVYVSRYYEPVFTDGYVTGGPAYSTGVDNEDALLDADNEVSSLANGSDDSRSLGGALNPIVFMMMCLFAIGRRVNRNRLVLLMFLRNN